MLYTTTHVYPILHLSLFLLHQIDTTEQMPLEEDWGYVEEEDDEKELENLRISPILERCGGKDSRILLQIKNT